MLTIQNVHKNYGTTKALSNVSLTIPTGSCFGLVGPNGAGKSTLIKLMVAIIADFKGTISYNNRPLLQDVKHLAGYVPQDICLEESVTARHNLAFFGKLHNIKGKHLQTRINEVLDVTGLRERGNDKVKTFSGGMKRRLNIGCALMNEPTLLILDEPTVGIDPQSRKYIFSMMNKLKKRGCTILYASHYMEEVEQLCDHVAFIDQGKIVETGTIDDILQMHAVPSVFIKGKEFSPTWIESFGRIHEKSGGYVLTTNDPLEALAHIVQKCRMNKCSLDRLELMHPRLEDVFFTLTGSALRDQS